MSQQFYLEYPDGREQTVVVADSAEYLFDESNPRRFANRNGWAAVITSTDGEPIDLDEMGFGPNIDDSFMWPLRGADGTVRKFQLDQIPSMPHAAKVVGSGAPLV